MSDSRPSPDCLEEELTMRSVTFNFEGDTLVDSLAEAEDEDDDEEEAEDEDDDEEEAEDEAEAKTVDCKPWFIVSD